MQLGQLLLRRGLRLHNGVGVTLQKTDLLFCITNGLPGTLQHFLRRLVIQIDSRKILPVLVQPVDDRFCVDVRQVAQHQRAPLIPHPLGQVGGVEHGKKGVLVAKLLLDLLLPYRIPVQGQRDPVVLTVSLQRMCGTVLVGKGKRNRDGICILVP